MCCAFRMVATTWKYGMFTLPIFMTKKVRLHHMNHCPVVRPREENATTKTSRVKTSQKTSENDWVSHPSMVFLLDSRASFRWSFWHCTIPKFGVFHHTECLGKKGEHITFLFGRIHPLPFRANNGLSGGFLPPRLSCSRLRYGAKGSQMNIWWLQHPYWWGFP